jgi:hypothetical protein
MWSPLLSLPTKMILHFSCPYACCWYLLIVQCLLHNWPPLHLSSLKLILCTSGHTIPWFPYCSYPPMCPCLLCSIQLKVWIHVCNISLPFHPPWTEHANNTDIMWRVQIMNLLSCNCVSLQSSSLFDPQSTLSTLLSKTFNVMLSP